MNPESENIIIIKTTTLPNCTNCVNCIYFFRNWNGGLWKNLFHALLNVPSCDELPNLAELRSQFEDYFVSDLLPKYNVMSQSFMKFLDR